MTFFNDEIEVASYLGRLVMSFNDIEVAIAQIDQLQLERIRLLAAGEKADVVPSDREHVIDGVEVVPNQI